MMIGDAVRFIKAVRTKELKIKEFSSEKIMAFAKAKGYVFTEEELVLAHKRIHFLFNQKTRR